MLSLSLALGSPRRCELLTQLGLNFQLLPNDVKKRRHPNEMAKQYVVPMAQDKAQAGIAIAAKYLAVLGADTIVVFHGEWLEKPRDSRHTYAILNKLSGNTHQVMTAIALADRRKSIDCLVTTEVIFCALLPEDIKRYVASGEPLDKAEGYGIQGAGSHYIRKINGSYHAVIGLPLVETVELFTHFQSLRALRS